MDLNKTPTDQPGADPSLQDIFPDLRPIRSKPLLAAVYGTGLMLYGDRDRHLKTQSFVKTHCITLLFIPLIAIGAYRVVNAPGGLYVLGRERLSFLAKFWSIGSVVCGLLFAAGLMWTQYTGTPEYQARKTLAAGEKELEKGNSLKAFSHFREVQDHRKFREAHDGMRRSLEQALDSDEPETQLTAVELALTVRDPGGRYVVPDIVERGLARSGEAVTNHPSISLALLNAIPTIDLNEEAARRKSEILDQLAARSPEGVEDATFLAHAFNDLGREDAVVRLLEPHKEALATSGTEGSRLLGQAFAGAGRDAEAIPLLRAYMEPRLHGLDRAAQVFEQAYEKEAEKVLAALRLGRAASPAWYRRMENASEEEQQRMVDEYIQERLASSHSFQRALNRYEELMGLIDPAFDLGMCCLAEGQSAEVPEQRQQMLEEAEKVFLSMRSAAGETPDYQLVLGQVYCWLGKFDEGEAEFEQVLEGSGRDPQILLSLGQTMRELGEMSRARTYLEEAYESATEPEQKYFAAQMRAVTDTGLDDEILWLERSDPKASQVQSSLHHSRGKRAALAGNREEAEEHYRRALAVFEEIEFPSSTLLNNLSLVHFSLFEITGDLDEFRTGVRMLGEAADKGGAESILLMNTSSMFLLASLIDLAAERMHPLVLAEAAVKSSGYLSDGQLEAEAIRDRMRSHPQYIKGIGMLEKALVLAPKSRGGYEALLLHHADGDNAAGVQRLLEKARNTEFDRTEQEAEARARLAGEMDPEDVESATATIRSLERLLAQDDLDSFNRAVVYGVKLDTQLDLVESHPEALDLDTALADVAELVATHPCVALRILERTLLLRKADAALRKQSPGWRAYAEAVGSQLEPGLRLVYGLRNLPDLREELLAEPHHARFVASQQHRFESFPDHLVPRDWAFWNVVDPAKGEVVKSALLKRQHLVSQLELEALLDPWDMSAQLSLAWYHEMCGDTSTAANVLRELAERGVSLPGSQP